jgi:hypothetical protein
VNAIVNFCDIFFNAQPARFGHVIYPLLFGLFYCVFSIIYTVAGGVERDGKNYIYSILDWNEHTLDAIVFALATIVFLSLMHLFLTVCVKIRIFIYKRIVMSKHVDIGNTERINVALEA